MKHTHTHPNWINLTEVEKQVVRKRNHAAAKNQEIIKELEERLSSPDWDSEEENIKYDLYKRKHPDYNPLLGSVKGMSIEENFYNKMIIAFNQYAKMGRK
jgi:hypothetical protein